MGRKLYAIGGFEGEFPHWVMRSEVFVYDLNRGTWVDGIPLPGLQAEHVQAVINGRIHVIGGRVPESEFAKHFDQYVDTDAHLVFDPVAGTWARRRPAPSARNSAAATVLDGRIFVVGGRKNQQQPDGSQLQHNVANLEVYDPRDDVWEIRAPMPQAQGGLAAAALDGKLYVFGGEQWTPTQQVFGAAWVYDPATDAWEPNPDLPTPRRGLAAAAVGQHIYAIGGCTVVGGGAALSTVESLLL